MIKVDAKKVIGELVESLKWCSGSDDFGPGGQAREGWQKGPLHAISLGDRVLKAMPDGVMVEIEQTEAEKEEERVYFETHPPKPDEPTA